MKHALSASRITRKERSCVYCLVLTVCRVSFADRVHVPMYIKSAGCMFVETEQRRMGTESQPV